jgi:hypothetical protein
VSVLVAAVFLVLSRYVYRLAVFANEQFGVLFMAVIDVHAGKVADYLDVDGIAKRVTDLAKVYAEPGERLEVARRYLQYFNARLPGLPRPVPIPKIEKALEAKPVDVALPTHPAGRESATPPDRKTPP